MAAVTDMQSFAAQSREDKTLATGASNTKKFAERIDMKFVKGRVKDMQEERENYLPHWREIGTEIMPRRSHFLRGRKNADGKKYNQEVLNSKATRSVRRAIAGFQSGMTPRTRPWFTIEPSLQSQLEASDVFEYKKWANDARDTLFAVMHRSNFYQSTQTCYADFVPFGIGCIQIDEDPGPNVIRTRVHPIGSYSIDVDEEGETDTFHRDYRWTLKKIIQKFGLNALSEPMREAAKTNVGKKYTINNMIYPNDEYQKGMIGPIGLPYTSLWWVDGEEEEPGPIHVAGYSEFPIFTPRFWKVGDETYAQSPGMDALPDVKGLKKLTELKLAGIEKQVWPAMKGPGSMDDVNQLPGAYNAIAQGSDQVTELHEVRIELAHLINEIAKVEDDIADSFFENIFTAIMDTARRQRTLGETEKIESEKFMMLGPVLENIIDDLLEPVVERIYAICERRGLLRELPEGLPEQSFDIGFVSILAQAQKALEAVGVEQTAAFVAGLSEQFPDARHRLDIDETIETYADAVGGQDVVRSREDAAKLAQQEQAAIQQQQQMEMAAQAASVAKDASAASLEGESVLSQAADQYAGGQA